MEKGRQRRFLKSSASWKGDSGVQPKTAALTLGMWIDRSAGDAKYKCGFAA
jgi:hypothetical protein